MLRPRAVLLTVVVALGACSRSEPPRSEAAGASATPLAASAAASGQRTTTTVIDFLGGLERCSLGHRGFLLDLGDVTMRTRSSGGKLVAPEIELHEHEGASWAGVQSRSLEMRFVSTTESVGENGITVEARVRGGAARGAAVYLNGRAIGNLSFSKGETKIAQLRASGASIQRGANDLLLRFIGATKGHDELAEIDWIRIGPNDGDAPYAAPTRADAIATVTSGGVSRRGVSLRAPGFARCSAQIPNGAVLEGWVAASGGEGEAEVRVLVDRAEPRVVGSVHVGGPLDPPGWIPLSLPLGDVGTLAAVELVARSSSKGARIVFAEPRVVAPAPAAESAPPKARGVALIVLGTVARRQLSIYGGPIAMPELAQIASKGTVFEAHRGTSNLGNGAVASMLTGQHPRDHGVAEPDAALPESVLTVAEAARQGGVATGMFTANPTTSAPFGFDRGFQTFVATSPNDDAPATSVFDAAGSWLAEHKNDRFFLVVHARGGHPPWDIADEEAKDLAPAGYTGSLEPKQAGESLAKARRISRLFADADRERAYALQARAVAAHDAALGRLMSQLRSLGRDKDTLVLVTSDIGVDAAAHVPFLEEDPLEEAALALPLVMKAPDGAAGARVTAPTSSVDLARTTLEALGLPPAPKLRGEPLWVSAARPADGPERPLHAASATRFSVRWGGFVYVGARDRGLRLCNLALDPDCVSDVRATHPLASELMHAVAFDELVKKEPPVVAPRVVPDDKLPSALRAWGR